MKRKSRPDFIQCHRVHPPISFYEAREQFEWEGVKFAHGTARALMSDLKSLFISDLNLIDYGMNVITSIRSPETIRGVARVVRKAMCQVKELTPAS